MQNGRRIGEAREIFTQKLSEVVIKHLYKTMVMYSVLGCNLTPLRRILWCAYVARRLAVFEPFDI